MRRTLRIGELAHLVLLPAKTIRYYEEIGLLPRAQRSAAGYRLYSNRDVERLNLVRRSKLLGLSLREIKEIVNHATDGQCGHLQQRLLNMLDVKCAAIDRQIAELRALKDDLRGLARNVADKLASGESETAEGAFCSCFEGPLETCTAETLRTQRPI